MNLYSICEAVGVAFGIVYVLLVIRQNVWCWPAGLVSAGLYVFVFFDARIYGAMALQGVYIALMVYGWYEWRRGGEEGGGLRVSRTPVRWRVALVLIGAVFAIAFGLFLRDRTDAALPFLDAGTTAFSLVAQFMTTRKWVENWLVWITVDLVYVGMYISQGLYPTTLLYGTFLVLAVAGFLKWRRSLGGTVSEGA